MTHLNVVKLSMLVKIKDSDYTIKYSFDKSEQEVLANKIISGSDKA